MEKEYLTTEQAIALLPDGDAVHTLIELPRLNSTIGADWPRDALVRAITDAEWREVAGAIAQAMGHGLAIPHPDLPTTLFIATRQATP